MDNMEHLIVSGYHYFIDKETKEKLPKEQKVVTINQYRASKCFLYYKNRETFEKILMYHDGSALHMPLSVCPSEFMEDLKYWDIKPEELTPCCYARYKKCEDENKLMNDIKADKKDLKQNHLQCSKSRLQRIRSFIWNTVQNNSNSTICKVSHL